MYDIYILCNSALTALISLHISQVHEEHFFLMCKMVIKAWGFFFFLKNMVCCCFFFSAMRDKCSDSRMLSKLCTAELHPRPSTTWFL